MSSEILVCPSCLKPNSIEREQFPDFPKCAACNADLLSDIPIEADRKLFDSLNEFSTLPILADFWGPWSGSSHEMVSIFVKLSKRFKGDAIFIKVNSESEQVLAVQLNINVIPAFILFKDGKEYHRLTGDQTETGFHAWLERYLRVKRKVEINNPSSV